MSSDNLENGKEEHSFMNEIWGGLAGMLVALPSSIAFGVLVYSAVSPQKVGEGAFVGMIGAAAMGIIAPLFGRTAALISAPCAPAAAVLSGLALELTDEGLTADKIIGLLALTALFSSILQILYGVLKGGRLIKYIPFPVVSGYLSGVGLIIALGQLPKLLGLSKDVPLLKGLISPEKWKLPGIAVGLITVTVMLIAPKITKKIPAAILGLFSGIAGYFLLGLFIPELMNIESNSLLIGHIGTTASFADTASARFHAVTDIRIDDMKHIAYSAVALSALLSIDSLKTCVVLDAMTKTRHNSNQELLGQGIANFVSFAAGGLPGAGTMGATLVNVTSGGRKIHSGVIEGIFTILAIAVLSPLIAWVPIAALAGILLVVAFRMFDWKAFRLLKAKETRFDFAVIAAVVIAAESFGLIAASGTGIGLSILLFMRDQIRISILRRRATLKDISSKTYRLEPELALLEKYGSEAAVYELQGNIFFGTTDHLFTQLEEDLKHCKFILFDMKRVQSLDYTAAHLFSLMYDRLKEHEGRLLFSDMPASLPTGQDLLKYLTDVGLVNGEKGGIRIFDTKDDAIEWMENRLLKWYGAPAKKEEKALDLTEIELLYRTDEETITALRKCIHEHHFKEGEKIFGIGDDGDEIFMIRRGVVQVFLPLKTGKHLHLATFGQGDYFGEMAFLDKHSRSADAVAKTDCDLYVLSRKEFNEQVQRDAVLGVRIFARIANVISLRLRQADIELTALEDG